jgi:hypothetical protein
MRAFVAWHRELHIEDLALIDEYFDQNEFEGDWERRSFGTQGLQDMHPCDSIPAGGNRKPRGFI